MSAVGLRAVVIQNPLECLEIAEAVEKLFSGVRDAIMIQKWTDLRNKDSFPPGCRFFVAWPAPTQEFFNSLSQIRT